MSSSLNAASSSWFHPAFVLLLLGALLAIWAWRRFSLRRGVQTFSFTLFYALLWLAAFGGKPGWKVDFYLSSDPLLMLVHTVASRVLLHSLLISLVFVVLAALMGRVFCSHGCPMGVLLDMSDRWLAKKPTAKSNHQDYRRSRKAKFAILLVCLGAAVVGINLLGYFDPLVLFTRFSAVLFYPFAMVLQDVGLTVIRPVATSLGWVDLAYLELILPIFEGALLMAGLMALLLLLSRLAPRFWCRALCPLGALLGWLGRWAPYRRRVGEGCTACNRCVRECPTGAIHEEGKKTDRSECIVCLHCTKTCPEKVVHFGFHVRKDAVVDLAGSGLSRRAFLGGAAGGLAAGMAMRTDMLHPTNAFTPLPIREDRLIRPPGSLPEPEFLTRCVRCGECMRACLTNTLQPDWYRAGLEGLWAPHLSLRHASCEQTCNVCGQVCPTNAIRGLTLVEKQNAKIGTAIIYRDRCIAWAQDRRCLICDEQCPYNAITFRHDAQHKVGLPVVNANKCNGCGQCEDKCPIIGDAAIIVTAHGELRLKTGSYVAEAKALGLVFEAKGGPKDEGEPDGDDTPPPDLAPAGPAKNKGTLPPGIIPE